jgi:hypothetical protein
LTAIMTVHPAGNGDAERLLTECGAGDPTIIGSTTSPAQPLRMVSTPGTDSRLVHKQIAE